MDATLASTLLDRSAAAPATALLAANPAGSGNEALAQDGARFDALMLQPPAAPAPAGPLTPEVAAVAAGPATLGDKILGGLRRTSATLEAQWRNVGAALQGSGALSVRDMLRLQQDLSTMSIQYELVGKVVTRSTQNIEQLVKLQ